MVSTIFQNLISQYILNHQLSHIFLSIRKINQTLDLTLCMLLCPTACFVLSHVLPDLPEMLERPDVERLQQAAVLATSFTYDVTSLQ